MQSSFLLSTCSFLWEDRAHFKMEGCTDKTKALSFKVLCKCTSIAGCWIVSCTKLNIDYWYSIHTVHYMMQYAIGTQLLSRQMCHSWVSTEQQGTALNSVSFVATSQLVALIKSLSSQRSHPSFTWCNAVWNVLVTGASYWYLQVNIMSSSCWQLISCNLIRYWTQTRLRHMILQYRSQCTERLMEQIKAASAQTQQRKYCLLNHKFMPVLTMFCTKEIPQPLHYYIH